MSIVETDELRPIRILVVDDNEADVLLTRKALEQAGVPHILDSVDDGVEALAYLRGQAEYVGRPAPDVVLLDLNMPRMDGQATLAEIRADESLSSVPVLILTTSDQPADMTASFENRAQCFVTKPSSVSEFGELIRAVVTLFMTAATLPDALTTTVE